MKKLIPVVLLAFTPSVALADITSKFTTSISVKVDELVRLIVPLVAISEQIIQTM